MTAVNSKTAFFFLKEAGKRVNDNGKICTLVTSLLGVFTPFYAAYAGTKAPVEHARLAMGGKAAACQQLTLERGKEGFAHGIVVRVTDRAH
ncbi:Short-chain dehydrogenase/reductase SDR [Cupriavidus basilensis]|uniref:Short-chain dehydrogenase/reductase SDR n=1 Tax=Cupriavidus basilensis TaxID=68895 RepID=A0A0C4YLS1_9BURK|nr:Short-chain dehydrogenase/reductase SDR [Cupriavidus basilensis]